MILIAVFVFTLGWVTGASFYRIYYQRKLNATGDAAQSEMIGDYLYRIMREDIYWKLRNRLQSAEKRVKEYEDARSHVEFLNRFNNS